MIHPIIPEDLFELNPNRKVSYFDGTVLVVDNWYKNYDEIYNVIQNLHVSRWKWHEEGANFREYYDCKGFIDNSFPGNNFELAYNQLISYIRTFFNDYSEYELEHSNYEFNYFKNKKRGMSSDLQHCPHWDQEYNSIIFLDKVCSGGTALYPNLELTKSDKENLNIFYDVSGLEKQIIPAAPNRMAMFRGKIMHGGYIEDHDMYVDDWRINQVRFLSQIKDNK